MPQISANTIFGRPYKGHRKHWRNGTPLIVPQGDEDAYPSLRPYTISLTRCPHIRSSCELCTGRWVYPKSEKPRRTLLGFSVNKRPTTSASLL